LKPIVYGLVHDASAAALITELAASQRGHRYCGLLFHILLEFGGVDFRSFNRAGSKKCLWEEIRIVQQQRDSVLHRAEIAPKEEAERSVAVASVVLEEVFPTVVTKLGLHLHDGVRVCKDWGCKYGRSDEGSLPNPALPAAASGGQRLIARSSVHAAPEEPK
jgi:hypothetical protein